MMALQELIRERSFLNQEKERLIAEYKSNMNNLDDRISKVEALINSGKKGFDVDRIERAESLIKIGSVNTRQRMDCVSRFIKKITETPEFLKSHYCGVKIYSGFGEQHEDHKLGYGPRHGSIVFRVELKEPSREMSPEEIDDVIWYLLNIKEIQSSEEPANG